MKVVEGLRMKFILTAAMLAMVLVIAMPAMSQDSDGATADVCQQLQDHATGTEENVPINIPIFDDANQVDDQQFLNDLSDDQLAALANSCNDFIADSTLQQDNELESGDQTNEFAVDVAGDGNDVCVPATQDGSTGNYNVVPVDQQTNGAGDGTTEQDDFEPGGIEQEEAPETATECSPTDQNSSAASG